MQAAMEWRQRQPSPARISISHPCDACRRSNIKARVVEQVLAARLDTLTCRESMREVSLVRRPSMPVTLLSSAVEAELLAAAQARSGVLDGVLERRQRTAWL
jgi:hypothetical protein